MAIVDINFDVVNTNELQNSIANAKKAVNEIKNWNPEIVTTKIYGNEVNETAVKIPKDIGEYIDEMKRQNLSVFDAGRIEFTSLIVDSWLHNTSQALQEINQMKFVDAYFHGWSSSEEIYYVLRDSFVCEYLDRESEDKFSFTPDSFFGDCFAHSLYTEAEAVKMFQRYPNLEKKPVIFGKERE